MDRWLYGGMRINDAHNFYYASATANWECGYFNSELHRMAKKAVKLESDSKSGYWSEVSQEKFKYRKKCLKEFLAKISVPNPNPKRLRSKPLMRYFVYSEGLYFKDKGEVAYQAGPLKEGLIDKRKSYDSVQHSSSNICLRAFLVRRTFRSQP